jgi:hypothetical protein
MMMMMMMTTTTTTTTIVMMTNTTVLMTCRFATDLYWHWQQKVSASPVKGAVSSTSSNKIRLHECTRPSLITFCRVPYHDNLPHKFSSPACTCLQHTTVYIALPFTNARPPYLPACPVEGRGFWFAFASLERSCDINDNACKHNFLRHFPNVT